MPSKILKAQFAEGVEDPIPSATGRNNAGTTIIVANASVYDMTRDGQWVSIRRVGKSSGNVTRVPMGNVLYLLEQDDAETKK